MVEVLIISGSESDKPIAEKAIEILNEFKVSNEFVVASAHRNPEKLESIISKTDAKVFIAIAGLSAALPGVVASKTTKPVIGVPVNVKLEGLDALLSTMQIPPGIPVATVGIDNGKNAGLLAIQILALSNERLAKELVSFRQKMKK
ncbi:5-(carboxyamino)imidazole ribonucleotide mutase [Candidatus Micrarchaeota archaeon]|nr:5-(carboxyamino)imidazole ribonucleotide mutase [Candidatus Micrarchaeota archaeon]